MRLLIGLPPVVDNAHWGKKNSSAYFLVDPCECLKIKVHQPEGFDR